MSIEDKFNAAVSVIRNLPKNGAYQPSHAMMLKFYSYYKQATEGWETRGARPPFWDVVGRAKWDAWNELGKMPRKDAMTMYVEELNKVTEKIVETMALTDNVADFLTSMDSYAGNPEDLELCIGTTLNKVRSQPNSPFGSRDTSPNRVKNSSISTQDFDDDEDFVDTIQDPDQDTNVRRKDYLTNGINHDTKLMNGYSSHSKPHHEVLWEVLQKATENLRRDLTLANERVKALEENQIKLRRGPITLSHLSPGTVGLIMIWPIVVYVVMNRISRKRN